MHAIPNERSDLLSAVQFNLALAHLRANSIESAKEIFGPLSTGTSKMQVKSLAILKRIRQSEAQGIPLQFKKEIAATELPPANASPGENRAHAAESETIHNRHEEVASALSSRPGERCCYLIYQTTAQLPQVKKMLEQNLRYMKRAAINKDQR